MNSANIIISTMTRFEQQLSRFDDLHAWGMGPWTARCPSCQRETLCLDETENGIDLSCILCEPEDLIFHLIF